jgi:hypothetical protein
VVSKELSMSQTLRAIRVAGAAGRQVTGTPFACISGAGEDLLPVMDSNYVPLASRTAEELQANAEELRRMAATATTDDVIRALLKLADRYAALAESRRAGADR